MLKLESVNSFYGDSHILQDVSLEVPTGGRVALLGRNGAGKSTLLRSIMNIGPQVRGDISWNDAVLGDRPAHERARAGLAMVPEDRRIFPQLTVMENLRMAWGAVPKAERTSAPEDMIRRFPMLAPIRERLGGVLSGGQQQLLAMARAALSRPRLLLLDEPTEGLAPVIVEKLAEDVLEICAKEGCGLLLCEQNIWFARRCTDYVYILETGCLVFSGNWREFDANSEIRARALSV